MLVAGINDIQRIVGKCARSEASDSGFSQVCRRPFLIGRNPGRRQPGKEPLLVLHIDEDQEIKIMRGPCSSPRSQGDRADDTIRNGQTRKNNLNNVKKMTTGPVQWLLAYQDDALQAPLKYQRMISVIGMSIPISWGREESFGERL